MCYNRTTFLKSQILSSVLLVLLVSSPSRPLAQARSAEPASNDIERNTELSNAQEDRITYRRLTTEDFLATGPPVEFWHRVANLKAVSCLRVVAASDLHVELSRREGVQKDLRVVAYLPHPRFVAVFDRLCSWWSPEPGDPAYALQHEQVHFAIAEYAARRLSIELQDTDTVVRSYGSSREAAMANLELKIRGLATRAMLSADREHKAFDAAVSASPAPGVQLEWVRKYESLLEGDEPAQSR